MVINRSPGRYVYTPEKTETNLSLHKELSDNYRRDLRSREEIKDQIMAFVKDFWDRNGYAPSIRDVSRGVETLSLSSTRTWIRQLIDEGRLVDNGAPTRYISLSE